MSSPVPAHRRLVRFSSDHGFCLIGVNRIRPLLSSAHQNANPRNVSVSLHRPCQPKLDHPGTIQHIPWHFPSCMFRYTSIHHYDKQQSMKPGSLMYTDSHYLCCTSPKSLHLQTLISRAVPLFL